MLKIIGVGDNTVDTYVFCRKRFPGGNALNVAVLAKRFGAASAYLGVLGDDANGALIKQALISENMDSSHCKFIKGIENAYAEVDLVEGERKFGNFSSGASALLHLDQSDLQYIHSFDVVHTSIYSHLDDQFERLRSYSRFLSFDFSNHLDDLDRIHQILPKIDVGIFSISDPSQPSPEQVIKDLNPGLSQIIILTLGKHGSMVYTKQQLLHQQTVPIDTVDTMGAGDAYIAGFLVEYHSSGSIKKAMCYASEKAAHNCLHMGAFGYGVDY